MQVGLESRYSLRRGVTKSKRAAPLCKPFSAARGKKVSRKKVPRCVSAPPNAMGKEILPSLRGRRAGELKNVEKVEKEIFSRKRNCFFLEQKARKEESGVLTCGHAEGALKKSQNMIAGIVPGSP